MDGSSRNFVISLMHVIRLGPEHPIVKSRLRVIFGVGIVLLIAGYGSSEQAVRMDSLAL